MKIHWRIVKTFALTGALFGLLLLAFTARSGHPRPDFPPSQGSYQAPNAQSIASHQRELDAELRVFMAEYRCTTPDSWRHEYPQPFDFPKLMVLKKDHTWQLMVTAWDYPAPPYYWTMLVCEGS